MERFVQQLADVLLAGEWNGDALLSRLQHVFEANRPWMDHLVDLIVEEFPLDGPASLEELREVLLDSYALHEAVRERPLVRGAPPPEMAESPWRVPALATSKELAVWLGLSVDQLTSLADLRGISSTASDARRHHRVSPTALDQRRRHYRYTWIAKRGGYRLLEAPKPRLRTIQRFVLDDIIAQIPPHTAAHGFRAGHSIASFATPHVDRDVVIRLDLQAFFTSVTRARVAAIFHSAGYPERVARTLAALCTHRTPPDVLYTTPNRQHDGETHARLRTAHLPQGAPSSGALANLAAFRFDVRVAAFAATIGARYTRYADDIAISGRRELARAASTLIARVGAIAFEEGFALNFRKTRVMTRSAAQRLTGLVVNDKLSVPRAEVERLRAILHNCARTGPAAQNRDGHPDFRAHLLGRIAWVDSIDAAKGARLHAIFDRIVWST
ncbi:MAG TPA: reverse transcriptase family protein [Kofleriaceae bacterium]|nr:reverse transcriptase family protein [Kofleriaceae bacterium]